ncbi:MAG: penicillin-binding protein 2 [Bacteroidetes bacterium]|nr:penicillin-binding protein 2 [Bacteroidota bacterium]
MMPLFNKPNWTVSEFANPTRTKMFKALIIIVFVLLFGRLFKLQVIDYNRYYSQSETQAIKKIRVSPVRGNIYDRHGNLMVYNVPSFTVTVTPEEFHPECMKLLSSIAEIDSNEVKSRLRKYETSLSVDEVKRILEKEAKISSNEINKNFKKNDKNIKYGDVEEILKKYLHADKIETVLEKYKKYSGFVPVKIIRDASEDVVAKLEEYSQYLAGVDVIVDSKRIYNFNCNMAHLLGYTREITGEQLKKYSYYSLGDMIGQNGLEQSYESILRGRDGVQFVAVNKLGQKVGTFENGKRDILPSSGFDLNLAIDMRLQELSEKLLAGRRGAVVAVDPNNGEVLIFASKPDYDIRAFSGKVPAELYNALSSDSSYPLLPRALQSQYPPGSTWKMLMALAGLQSGVINENTTITCTGSYTFGGRSYKCHGACGSVNVRQAIRSSCNTFFYVLGMRLGMENFEKYGKMFGFGEKTHIDLPNEKRGRLPSAEWLRSKDKTLRSFKSRLINYGIGQGEILVTPLQMACYIAAIANNGTYYQPHITRSVYNQLTKKTDYINYDSRKIKIDPKYFEIVKNGMWDVVNAGGTGHGVQIPGVDVCGKTGTAQNPHGLDHSWFVCFAPRVKPKIAMCVFVENAGFGATVAGPITRRILEAFFFPNRSYNTAGASGNDSLEVFEEIEHSANDSLQFPN